RAPGPLGHGDGPRLVGRDVAPARGRRRGERADPRAARRPRPRHVPRARRDRRPGAVPRPRVAAAQGPRGTAGRLALPATRVRELGTQDGAPLAREPQSLLAPSGHQPRDPASGDGARPRRYRVNAREATGAAGAAPGGDGRRDARAAWRKARHRRAPRGGALLGGHVLGGGGGELLPRHAAPVDGELAARYRSLVARRAGGEPVAYLLGE